jgi:tRNA-specific 2-thiouridylase
MARIAVAMSGGVDSSVTAALLRGAGHEVLGFTLRLGSADGDWQATRACCGLTEVHDARRVADRLDIPHYVLNHAAAFEATVIADFLDEYAAGRTPNPCIRCNQYIKFAAFLDHARALGCEAVATGHYARLDQAPDGRRRLRRGIDATKDQSYVLHTLTQDQLAASLLPLGELTKTRVRALAMEMGLATAAKPDSQEICFVEGRPGDFVARLRPAAVRPGPIVDAAGTVLGRHRGLPYYTVGQRRGLGLGGDEPLFVSELRAADNTLVVAPAADAGRRAMVVEGLNWVSRPEPRAGDGLDGWVQVRYRMKPEPGRLTALGPGRGAIDLAQPVLGVAPGQSAVVYDDQGYVLAGGVIAGTENLAA